MNALDFGYFIDSHPLRGWQHISRHASEGTMQQGDNREVGNLPSQEEISTLPEIFG